MVLGLASLLTAGKVSSATAQIARVEVTATVVDAAPGRAAMGSARWLAARKNGGRRDSGLATVVVTRDRRKVSINYLKN